MPFSRPPNTATRMRDGDLLLPRSAVVYFHYWLKTIIKNIIYNI